MYVCPPLQTGDITEIVIQQKISGTEYFVDTCNINDEHIVCGVFRYHKIIWETRVIYRWMELVDYRDPAAQISIDYVTKCLDAIGFRFGLAHTELFFTEEGPRLIEINPRISGAYGYANKMAKLAARYFKRY